jgi:hypothetical protein
MIKTSFYNLLNARLESVTDLFRWWSTKETGWHRHSHLISTMPLKLGQIVRSGAQRDLIMSIKDTSIAAVVKASS